MCAVAGLFLLQCGDWIGARFGENHDGRNAATWAEGSRALREDGPLASRFGGRTVQGPYASHPPGIIAETALAESIAGEHRLVSRSPAWLGSLASIALCAWLLVSLRMRPTSVAAALAVVFTTAMFQVYGSMLDTPVTSFPFAVGIVLLAQRAIDGRRTRTAALASVALLAALTGWLAAAIAGTQAIRLLLRGRRTGAGVGPALAVAGGTALGLVVSAAWSLWVYGSFATLRAKATDKSSSASLATSLGQQWRAALDLYPLALAVGLGGAALALLLAGDRRWLGAFVSTAVPVVAYGLVFRGGADMHDYWNYGALLPLAIGAAAGVDALVGRSSPRATRAVSIAVLVVAALGGIVASKPVSDGEAKLRSGLVMPDLLDAAAAANPGRGPVLAYLAPPGFESPWIAYEARRPGLVLRSREQVAALARRDGDVPVLVVVVRLDDRAQELVRASAYAEALAYAVVPASVAAEVLPVR